MYELEKYEEMHDYIKKLYDEASENVQGTEKSMKAARRSTPMHRSIPVFKRK